MITVPIHVVFPRKTKKDVKKYMSLNTYRNAHHILLWERKTRYHDSVAPLVEKNRRVSRLQNGIYKLDYTYYWLKTNSDLGNIHAVVSKFFEDILVSTGTIPDDNIKNITAVSYSYGGTVEKWFDWFCSIELIPCRE